MDSVRVLVAVVALQVSRLLLKRPLGNSPAGVECQGGVRRRRSGPVTSLIDRGQTFLE